MRGERNDGGLALEGGAVVGDDPLGMDDLHTEGMPTMDELRHAAAQGRVAGSQKSWAQRDHEEGDMTLLKAERLDRHWHRKSLFERPKEEEKPKESDAKSAAGTMKHLREEWKRFNEELQQGDGKA